MKYTLLVNFVPTTPYEGTSGLDAHGRYILFPANICEPITVSDFFNTPSGETIQITEESSQIINGAKYLKLYYH